MSEVNKGTRTLTLFVGFSLAYFLGKVYGWFVIREADQLLIRLLPLFFALVQLAVVAFIFRKKFPDTWQEKPFLLGVGSFSGVIIGFTLYWLVWF